MVWTRGTQGKRGKRRMGRQRGERQRGQGQGREHQTATMTVIVLHPMAPADLRLVLPAHPSYTVNERVQREICEVLGPPPEGEGEAWAWRCISPDGPVKTRLMVHPPRTPWKGA